MWDEPGVASYIEGFWDSPGEVALRQDVANWIGPQQGKSLLDVGCGSGRMYLLLQDCLYTGMDGSQEMLKLARERAPQATFLQADILASSLPCADKAYDVALCMHVMRHLPGYEKLLVELARAVREGVFVVDAFHSEGPHSFATSDVANQTFLENSWSLPIFLADVAVAFPGWRITSDNLSGVIGVRIIAP